MSQIKNLVNSAKPYAAPIFAVSFLLGSTFVFAMGAGFNAGFDRRDDLVDGQTFADTPSVSLSYSDSTQKPYVWLNAARDSKGNPNFYISYGINYSSYASAIIEPAKVLQIFTDGDLDKLEKITVEKFDFKNPGQKVTPSEVKKLIAAAREAHNIKTASR